MKGINLYIQVYLNSYLLLYVFERQNTVLNVKYKTFGIKKDKKQYMAYLI